jgi:hypothetical protein
MCIKAAVHSRASKNPKGEVMLANESIITVRFQDASIEITNSHMNYIWRSTFRTSERNGYCAPLKRPNLRAAFRLTIADKSSVCTTNHVTRPCI